jgi:fluoride ion exporter CrcB/FEX
MKISDWIGFLGVFTLLIAFFLNIINVLHKNSYAYMLMNIIGAGIACIASILINYWPFIILEGIWTLVSLGGLIQTLVKSKQ